MSVVSAALPSFPSTPARCFFSTSSAAGATHMNGPTKLNLMAHGPSADTVAYAPPSASVMRSCVLRDPGIQHKGHNTRHSRLATQQLHARATQHSGRRTVVEASGADRQFLHSTHVCLPHVKQPLSGAAEQLPVECKEHRNGADVIRDAWPRIDGVSSRGRGNTKVDERAAHPISLLRRLTLARIRTPTCRRSVGSAHRDQHTPVHASAFPHTHPLQELLRRRTAKLNPARADRKSKRDTDTSDVLVVRAPVGGPADSHVGLFR